MLTCGFMSGTGANYLSDRKDSPEDCSFVALLNSNLFDILLCSQLAEGAGNISGGSFMRHYFHS